MNSVGLVTFINGRCHLDRIVNPLPSLCSELFTTRGELSFPFTDNCSLL